MRVTGTAVGCWNLDSTTIDQFDKNYTTITNKNDPVVLIINPKNFMCCYNRNMFVSLDTWPRNKY